MKNGPLKGGGSCKYMPVIMQRFTQTKKEVRYVVKKNPGRSKSRVISCQHYKEQIRL